jgi:hypothetical protein
MGSKLHVTIRGLRTTRNDANKGILADAPLEAFFFDSINLLVISNNDNKTTNKYSNPINPVVHLTSIPVSKLYMEYVRLTSGIG